MQETRIYKHDKKQLHELLKMAGDPQGDSTLLIPDLQREYVWAPSKVTALVDSLLRGWPFGTLLLWSLGEVREEDEQVLPSRPFWQTIDGTGGSRRGNPYGMKGKPATYKMVLDGQQRIQSLLLATQGGDAGFKLSDAEWVEDRDGRPSQANRKYWSRAQLYLDLDAFESEYVAAGGNPMRINYLNVLRWLGGSARDNHSPDRGSQYEAPIESADPKRHVRLAALWKRAKEEWRPEERYKNDVVALLTEHGLPAARIDSLARRLAELLSIIGGIKATEVAYLEVKEPQDDFTEEERAQYDEAVVSIFTRLNTGGEPLTEQEIMFAWIKRKWDPAKTQHRQADQCFEELRGELDARSVNLRVDKLVQGVSVVWSAVEGAGILLGQSQFVRSDVGKLAPWVCDRWPTMHTNFVEAATILSELGLLHGKQYESENSLFVLWAWRTLALEWLRSHEGRFLQRESVQRRIERETERLADRWMLLPAWAGRWQEARSFPRYVTDLFENWKTIRGEPDADVALRTWVGRMESWIQDAVPDATSYVDRLHAERRNTVRRYHGALWAWLRLDPERAAQASLALVLKTRGQREVEVDVDHVVAYNHWKSVLAEKVAPAKIDDLLDGPNALGNTLLLAKNFNIGKQDQSLGSLLQRIDDFRWDRTRRVRWEQALALPEELIEPGDFSLDEIRAAIRERTSRIRDDLKRFVRGEATLHDVPEAAQAPAQPWAGQWRTEWRDERTGESAQVEMDLVQDGRTITGTYGLGSNQEGRITSTSVDGGLFEGRWKDSGEEGGFRFVLDDAGGAFRGEWGRGVRRRGRGPWNGQR